MVKRGVSAIFIFVFSILLIASFSGFISAGCSGTLQCSRITSSSTCNLIYTAFRACQWIGSSCTNYASATCASINDASMCTAAGCSWSSCQCTSGVCCDGCNYITSSSQTVCETISAYYTCSSGSIYIQSHVRYCSGTSSSCTGSEGIINTFYQSCSNGVCDQDNFYPAPLCACAGTTSTNPNEYCECETGPGAPSCCKSHATRSCYNGDVYWYDSCGTRQDLYDDCDSTEICSNGQCVLACIEDGASCTYGGTGSGKCCSGLCVEGYCRSSCNSYTTSENQCSNSSSYIWSNYGICTSGGGCDASVAALFGGTYYSDCSGRSDGTAADTDSLERGFVQNGICCSGTPTVISNYGSSCTVGTGACQRTGTITCNGCSVTPGSPSTEICDNIDNDCDGSTDEECDDDNDNYCDSSMTRSGTPSTCTSGGGDCNDVNSAINPGHPEAGHYTDGLNNDCDSYTDFADSDRLNVITCELLSVCIPA